MPKPKAKTWRDYGISVVIPAELHARLTELCRKQGYKIGGAAAHAVSAWVEAKEKAGK